MVFCTSCGTKCEDGARFCINCGTSLLSTTTATAPSKPTTQQPPPQPQQQQQEAKPTMKGVPCSACGKPIGTEGSDAYGVSALGKRFHKDCFKCSVCSERLFSFSRFFEENGKPVCAKCNAKTVPRCSVCLKPVDGSYIQAMGKSFHPECMKCAGCGQPFGEDGFFEDKGKLWHLTCAH